MNEKLENFKKVNSLPIDERINELFEGKGRDILKTTYNIFESIYKKNVDLLIFDTNYAVIRVYIPYTSIEVIEKNGDVGLGHKIYGLYIDYNITIEEKSIYLSPNFSIQRNIFTQEEIESGYVHSHINTEPFTETKEYKYYSYNSNISTFCLGNSQVSKLVNKINKTLKTDNIDALKFDILKFTSYIDLNYLKVESSDGIPYKNIKDIGRKNRGNRYNISDYMQPELDYYTYAVITLLKTMSNDKDCKIDIEFDNGLMHLDITQLVNYIISKITSSVKESNDIYSTPTSTKVLSSLLDINNRKKYNNTFSNLTYFFNLKRKNTKKKQVEIIKYENTNDSKSIWFKSQYKPHYVIKKNIEDTKKISKEEKLFSKKMIERFTLSDETIRMIKAYLSVILNITNDDLAYEGLEDLELLNNNNNE